MSNLFRILCLVLLCVLNACVSSQRNLDQNVSGFLTLLVQEDDPKLSEQVYFSGESNELELAFELKECDSRGWNSHEKLCIMFTKKRRDAANKEKAYYLSWIRDQFSLAGKSFKIINIEQKETGFPHELITVKIGSNNIVLFHNLDPKTPTGLLVGISAINGRKVSDYIK